MIQVFRDEHLGEQAGGRDTLVNDVRRHGRLDQPLTAATDPFAADVPLHLKDPWRVVELLAHILADALKTTAAAALGILRLVMDLPAWEDCRERYTARLFLLRRRRLLFQGFEFETDRFDIRIDALIEKRALHGVHLLATPIEVPTL